MLDKLESLAARYEQIATQLGDPAVIADRKRFKELNKSYRDLEEIVNAYHEYKNVISNLDHAKDALNNKKDEELKQMAKEEIEELSTRKEKLEDRIRLLLVPKDPEDDRYAVVEIRAGTGGDE